MIKKIGRTCYVHKSNLEELLSLLTIEERYKFNAIYSMVISAKFPFDIIKYNRQTDKISFIASPDWDTANEPTVGGSYCFDAINGDFKFLKASNKIYHNKWQFVATSYNGFDVETAKQRTKLWNSIPDIKSHKSRIGNREYWQNLLSRYSIAL